MHKLTALFAFPLLLLTACASTSSTPVEESYVRTDGGALLSFPPHDCSLSLVFASASLPSLPPPPQCHHDIATSGGNVEGLRTKK